MKKDGYICVEAAVVMGLYLTILGSIIILGINLYKAAEKETTTAIDLISVEELCRRHRVLQEIKDLTPKEGGMSYGKDVF